MENKHLKTLFSNPKLEKEAIKYFGMNSLADGVYQIYLAIVRKFRK